MDTKRLLIAVVASVAIVVGWNYTAQYFGLLPPPVVEQATVQGESSSVPVVPASIVPSPNLSSAILTSPVIAIETPLYTAELAVDGGTMRSFVLKKYFVTPAGEKQFQFFTKDAIAFAPLGLLLNAEPTWGQGTWQPSISNVTVAGNEKKTVRLIGKVGAKNIVRELTFSADTYLITEKTYISLDEGSQSQPMQLAYTMGASALSESSDYNAMQMSWYMAGSLDSEKDTENLAKGMEVIGNVEWTGIMDHYFLLAIAPNKTEGITLRNKYEGTVFRTALYESIATISTTPTEFTTSYWIGPKESTLLDVAPNQLSASINYGFFSFLSRPLVLFLEFIYAYVHNYGIAIILLTIIIKLIFWPLSQKSFSSMNKMKKVQPLVQEIREKHKDNKEEMNKEIMSLYKTYKVNPMGGCLPLLVQIPVFFALYEALLNSVALRHAIFIEYLPFTNLVWLADLSTKDPFYITPIAMGISMFIQQLITPSTGDPTQRKIMLAMPVVFTVFFLGFPSGLVIYWLSSNVISIIQQWIMLKRSSS